MATVWLVAAQRVEELIPANASHNTGVFLIATGMQVHVTFSRSRSHTYLILSPSLLPLPSSPHLPPRLLIYNYHIYSQHFWQQDGGGDGELMQSTKSSTIIYRRYLRYIQRCQHSIDAYNCMVKFNCIHSTHDELMSCECNQTASNYSIYTCMHTYLHWFLLQCVQLWTCTDEQQPLADPHPLQPGCCSAAWPIYDRENRQECQREEPRSCPRWQIRRRPLPIQCYWRKYCAHNLCWDCHSMTDEWPKGRAANTITDSIFGSQTYLLRVVNYAQIVAKLRARANHSC